MASAVIAFIVFIERSVRRIVVQYPKRQHGNKVFGGDQSFLPLKINVPGVIPPIFASSLLLMPVSIVNLYLIPRKLQIICVSMAAMCRGSVQASRRLIILISY